MAVGEAGLSSLDNHAFMALPLVDRGIYMHLMLVAVTTGNKIPVDQDYVQWMLRTNEPIPLKRFSQLPF